MCRNADGPASAGDLRLLRVEDLKSRKKGSHQCDQLALSRNPGWNESCTANRRMIDNTAVQTPVDVSSEDRRLVMPAQRDEILSLLETFRQTIPYSLLTSPKLRRLPEIRAPSDPLIRPYLQLTPERRRRGAWWIASKDIAKAFLKHGPHGRARKQIEEELLRIEHALEK